MLFKGTQQLSQESSLKTFNDISDSLKQNATVFRQMQQERGNVCLFVSRHWCCLHICSEKKMEELKRIQQNPAIGSLAKNSLQGDQGRFVTYQHQYS